MDERDWYRMFQDIAYGDPDDDWAFGEPEYDEDRRAGEDDWSGKYGGC